MQQSLINRIIHIVDTLLPVNFGIWNAAISPSETLWNLYNIKSECWYPADKRNGNLPVGIKGIELQSLRLEGLNQILQIEKPDSDNTLIITHGVWNYPTRWGNYLAKRGYRWWYVPHGMLEPWSMQQKWLKKQVYFNLIEKNLVKKAEVIRAVGKPEQNNLTKLFGREIVLIPNGIEADSAIREKSFALPRKYVFISRLHHKKGILPLVEAWYSSNLSDNKDFELIIAGPDDGELSKIQHLLSHHPNGNVNYAGAVYGAEKKKLLEASHFFLLPSQSEGFPTSIPEAMQYGLIPFFSEGCNFPEAFEAGVAIKTGIEVNEIRESLESSLKYDEKSLIIWSKKISQFVREKYSLPVIAGLIKERIV